MAMKRLNLSFAVCLGAVIACGTRGDATPSPSLPTLADAATDAVPARCSFTTSLPIVVAERLGEPCTVQSGECGAGRTCARFLGRAEDAGPFTGRCVIGDACAGAICPPCHSCEVDGVALVSCALNPEASPAVKYPELQEQRCTSGAECSEDRLCIDARAIDDRQTTARCAKVGENPCMLVECGARKRCVSSDDGNVVRLTCVPQ